MELDPATIFSSLDLVRARRLNALLLRLPRYHTSRRWNARLLNTAMVLGQHFIPSPKGVATQTRAVVSGDHALPLRVLWPQRKPEALLLHFHGGAWVLGTAKLDDHWNGRYVRNLNVAVASGDFHQALDDDLEQAIADAVAILRWVLDHLDRFGIQHVILEGESSGAHLAACAMIRLAAERPLTSVAAFVSFCGAFDMAGGWSRTAPEDALIIDQSSALQNLHRLTDALPADARSDPKISPIHADLTGMPPALFIAGDLDPIADDSRRMYARWGQQASADLLLVPEAPHGFERLPTRLAASTRRLVDDWLGKRLSGLKDPLSPRAAQN